MRRVLYLWAPHLHTAVERLLSPGPGTRAAGGGQPVVVASGSFARGVVVDASPEAEALGVGAGQSWRHARRHAPMATFIPYEAWRYRPFTERIGGLLHELTPWVETLPGSEEEFFADLGAGPLEEGERLAHEVVDAVRDTLGLEARAALATGKLVARTVCRYSVFGVRCSDRPEDRIPKTQDPRPNTEHRTPNTVPPGMERRFLRPLSLDYLWDMQPEHRRRLGPLGLRTFGQLAAVPQRLLIGQFGPVGRWYRLLAAGIDARRVKPWSPHPTVSSRLLVEEDDADLPLLEGYLDLLARRVSDTLIATGQYTRVISLTLAMDGACPFASRHLKAPTNLPGPIYQAARGLLVGLLEQIVNRAIGDCRSADGSPHVGRLRRLGHADYRPHSGKPSSLGQLRGTLGGVPSTQSLTLIAGSLETRGLLQLSLFGDPDRGPALRAAIACIQERFGEQAVMTGIGWRVNGAPDR